VLRVIDIDGCVFEIDADGFIKNVCPDLEPRFCYDF